MHPKYKSNSNTRSQHVYLSLIFSQEVPRKRMFHQNEGVNLKKKGMDPKNKRVKRILKMMVKEDPRTTAVQEARRSTSPDGTREGMASGEQDKDKMKLMTTWGVCRERGDLPL